MTQPKEHSVKILEDVAEALNLSKSTVSRAISGNGRISAETRARVLSYVQKHDYQPNSIAASLARSKTNNLGVIIPADALNNEVPFFQGCLMGICETAVEHNYDVLVTSVSQNDISMLKRIVTNKKVDGVLLTRSHIMDPAAEYLQSMGVPFVLAGSSSDAKVVQVDTDNVTACKALTDILLDRGVKRAAMICGSFQYVVNRDRYTGYCQSLQSHGLTVDEQLVYGDRLTGTAISQAVRQIISQQAQAIVCGDDFIADKVMTELQDCQPLPAIRLASFYNSRLLSVRQPIEAVIDIDPKQFGAVSGAELINLIEGRPVPSKTFIDYRIDVRS